jgi:hypothetical protein
VLVDEVPWGMGKHTATKVHMQFLEHGARKLSWKETAEEFRTSWDKVHDAVAYLAAGGLEHRVLGAIRAESFGFPGFAFRRIRSRRGRWMPLLLPKGKKRTALPGKLKEIFRASRSQPVGGVIEKINPIPRGWVRYFAIGRSSRCVSYIRNWVETRIRRHLARPLGRGVPASRFRLEAMEPGMAVRDAGALLGVPRVRPGRPTRADALFAVA